jgi:hypothetical protein
VFGHGGPAVVVDPTVADYLEVGTARELETAIARDADRLWRERRIGRIHVIKSFRAQ